MAHTYLHNLDDLHDADAVASLTNFRLSGADGDAQTPVMEHGYSEQAREYLSYETVLATVRVTAMG